MSNSGSHYNVGRWGVKIIYGSDKGGYSRLVFLYFLAPNEFEINKRGQYLFRK